MAGKSRSGTEADDVDGTPWCCPYCQGVLSPLRGAWGCGSCASTFRALRGIPDLRTSEDVYLGNEDDWAFALKLDAAYDALDFRGLLDLYFELSAEVTPEQRAHQVAHILTAPGRVAGWLDVVGPVGYGPLLDLGCGSGSFLAAVGGRRPEALGVDIAMRWLLVARKRLDEEGLADIPLACACAEALPLSEGSVSSVVAGDVFEHVADQRSTLREAYRVLRPGGRLFLASPNRFSLAPEPHVHVWGVGYLPRRWMAPYVRAVKGVEFRAVRTLGVREWRRALAASPFGTGRVEVPGLPAGDFARFSPLKRAAARIYNAAVATGPGRLAALEVGPLFHVVCDKPAPPRSVPGPTVPSPAIRRPTTPPAARR